MELLHFLSSVTRAKCSICEPSTAENNALGNVHDMYVRQLGSRATPSSTITETCSGAITAPSSKKIVGSKAFVPTSRLYSVMLLYQLGMSRDRTYSVSKAFHRSVAIQNVLAIALGCSWNSCLITLLACFGVLVAFTAMKLTNDCPLYFFINKRIYFTSCLGSAATLFSRTIISWPSTTKERMLT